MSKTTKSFFPEVRGRAIRMVLDNGRKTKLVALKIEVQRGLGAAELQVLADDMAEEVAGLRATEVSSTRDAASAITLR